MMSTDHMERELHVAVRRAFDAAAEQVPGDVSRRIQAYGYRPRTQSRALLATTTLGLAALAAGTVAVAAGPSGSPGSPGGGSPAIAVPSPRLSLAAAVRAAIAGHEKDVFHAHWAATPGYPMSDRWSDSTGSRLHIALYSLAGQKVGDVSYAGAGGPGSVVTTTTIDYTKRTWSTARDTLPSLSGAPAPGLSPVTIEKNAVSGPTAASDIAALLNGGGFTKAADTKQVDGKTAYTISSTANGLRTSMDIDSASNLPVHVTLADPAGKLAVSADLEWLAPTAANLALLHVGPPAGFTQVPPTG